MTDRMRSALFWASILWAAVVLLIYEFKFPLPVGESARILRAAATGVLPLSLSRAPGLLFGLLREFWALAVFVLIQAACLHMGRRMWVWVRGSWSYDGPRMLLGFLAGLVVAGHMILGLALTGLALRSILLVPLLFFLVMGPTPEYFSGAWRKISRAWKDGAGLLGGASKYAAVFGTMSCLVILLVPEIAVDPLIYHRAIPARALGMHKLCAFPGNFNFLLPSHLEMLGLWGMALGGEAAARLWGLSGILAGAVALFLLVRRLGTEAWAWFALAFWMTSPFAVGLVAAGKPDIFMAPLFLGAYMLTAGRQEMKRFAVLSGLLAGAAVSMKLTSAPAAAALAAVLVPAWRHLGAKAAAARISLFLLSAAVVFLPWSLKSFLSLGDPFYPFGGLSPEGIGMSKQAVLVLRKYLSFIALGSSYDSVYERILLTWNSVMKEGLPAFLLALTPFALTAGRGACGNKRLWLGGALMLIAWMLGPALLRYAVPGLAWVLAAILLCMASVEPVGRRAAVTLAAGILLLQSLRIAVSPWLANSVLAAAGLEGRKAFMSRNLGTYADVMEYLAKALPKRARVMFVGECRSYPPSGDFRTPSICEPFAMYRLVMASDTLSAFERRVKQAGVTHVVHNQDGAIYTRYFQSAYPWTSPGLSIWSEFWRRHARLEYYPRRLDLREGGYYVYRMGEPWLIGKATPTLPGIEGGFAAIESRMGEGRTQDAFELSATLDQLAGDFPAVAYFLGVRSLKEDPIRAVEYLKKADAGGLRMISLWEALARQAEERWRLEESVAYWEKVRRFEPRAVSGEYVSLLVKISRQSSRLGRYRAAENYLRRAASISRKDAKVWAELALFHLGRENRKEALTAATEAVRLEPHNREYRDLLAKVKRSG